LALLKRKATETIDLKHTKSSVFRIGADGTVLQFSGPAVPHVQLWQEGWGPLCQAVEVARDTGAPHDARIEDAEGNSFFVVIVPEGKDHLVIVRDTTLPDRMTAALLESRALLKDLLVVASDLAFEVDAAQRFLFVAPQEALGRTTDAWLGRSASRIFWPDGDAPARNPFKARRPGAFPNVPIELPSGEKRWLHFEVRPQLDDDGNLVSLRGTCRDTTERYLAERAHRQDSLRFMLLQRITTAINQAESAEETLDNASAALLDVLRADMVWAAMKYSEGLVPSSVVGSHREILDMDSIWRTLCIAETPVITVDGGTRDHLALRLERGGEGLGMVIISRDTGVSPWSSQEVELLSGVVDVLTAAFRKAELIETLYRLSSNDELTGILNRRALKEAVNRRLKHQLRTGVAGCLVFIDLDHFKEVNDTLGHKAGDKALKLVAEAMEEMIRPCDFAGRYGGDEFIIWFEDMTSEKAADKARGLIAKMPEIRRSVGSEDLQLGASVGICRSIPGKDLKFSSLADRADAVLYDVKEAGRGDVAIAPEDRD